MPTSRRIRIILSYDGTDFHGWQVQPGLPTIQSALHAVLDELEAPCETRINVAGSGRTDAGVHALGQVAAFHLINPIPLENLQKVMNRKLPRAIRVLKIDEVPEAFHPRFDAIAKTYEYRILRTELCSPFERHYVHHFPYPLNEQRMTGCAVSLVGEHDFTAFAASDEKDALGHSKVRKIFASQLTRENDRLIYRVTGSGFLKHMVRNIVGVLLEAGKGNLTQADLLARLRPGNEIPAGPTAPARGLFLVSVEYPQTTVIE